MCAALWTEPENHACWANTATELHPPAPQPKLLEGSLSTMPLDSLLFVTLSGKAKIRLLNVQQLDYVKRGREILGFAEEQNIPHDYNAFTEHASLTVLCRPCRKHSST